MSNDNRKKKIESSNVIPFPQLNDIKLSDFDGELRRKVAELFQTRNLSENEVETFINDEEFDLDLQINKMKLKKIWGDRYSTLLAETKQFADSLPNEVTNKPLTATAEGIKFLLRHKQLLDHLNPTRKLH